MTLLEAFFWVSVFLVIYVQFGFDFMVTAWASVSGEPKRPEGFGDGKEPHISVIIAAHNEERVIEQRIRNLLDQNYPKEKREIIVASDGSSDRTVEICRRFSAENVKVLAFERNRGRAAVHNDAIREATAEILVFTDSETVFENDFLRKAVSYFSELRYGCGAGDLTFRPLGEIGNSEGIYWRMDKRLRMLEYKIGVAAFVSGGCFLIRKSLCPPVADATDIDCSIPYWVLAKGFDIFYASDAKAYDLAVAHSAAHYKKRVRTALKGIVGALMFMPALFAARRFAAIWIVVSHRLLRWGCGYFFAGALAANIFLARRHVPLYDWLLLCQAVFYGLGLLGFLWDHVPTGQGSRLGRVTLLVYSFILAQVAFIDATIRLLVGRQIISYEPVSHL